VSTKLKCYWYGYGGGSWMAERLRYVIENKLDMQLVTIHEHPDANIKWDLNSVFEELKKADIIILPANFKRQPGKSANRLTQAMALGKPIICEPMPSYIPIVKNLHNAIILKNGSEDEWEFALDLLKNDSELRDKLSKNALETSKDYTVPQISKKWLDLLAQYDVSKKEIDVIIPTKRNIPIIKECLKSFENSTLEENIYIIDNDTETNLLENLVKEMGFDYEIREI
jgi:glycosyltransferase involved in cell wall biosynthesis